MADVGHTTDLHTTEPAHASHLSATSQHNQGLLILHLSDLHFGNKNRFGDRDLTVMAKGFCRSLEHARLQLKIEQSIRLVIVSGDLAETGHPPQFEQARQFLEGLSGQLGVAPHNFAFVPGNHDLSWPLCKIEVSNQEMEQFTEGELRQRMDRVKFRFYDQFIKDFYGCLSNELRGYKKLANGACLRDFPELGVTVACLNTCELESHRLEDHRGHLSQKQAESLMEVWRSATYRSYLKIVVVHHNPIATTPENIREWLKAMQSQPGADATRLDRYVGDLVGFEGRELLRAIVRDCEVQLVLHGHHHDQGDVIEWPWAKNGRAPVLSTGSWGLRANELPGDAPPSCQLIYVDCSAAETRLEAFPLVFAGRFRLAGETLEGNFVLDSAERGRYNQVLRVPDNWQSQKSRVVRHLDDRTLDFIRLYRQRASAVFERWDLRYTGIPDRGGANRTIEARLDNIFQPLRFRSERSSATAEIFDIDQIRARFDSGADQWLAVAPVRPRCLLVCAPAGSGKTTWMRFMFRRLLQDSDLLPVMIVCRDLAVRWSASDCQGGARSVDTFMDDFVTQYVGEGWKGDLHRLFEAARDTRTPKLVVLVDGWDELGPFGVEFRDKLRGFQGQFPHVLIAATSRPYGETKPTQDDDFEAFSVEPLSMEEITAFAGRFFERCYESDKDTCELELSRFCTALSRSPDASDLARTMLMLVMMLFISRTDVLPEKRHLLYESCINSLLTAHQQRGVPLSEKQYRPHDRDTRRQLVAALAHDVQVAGYADSGRSVIFMSWDEMARKLPESWEKGQKDGFLHWLAGPAALLTMRSDNYVSFAHLSFQEFLTAWHLHAKVVERDESLRRFTDLVGDKRWWETLLLWAWRIASLDPSRLTPIMSSLMSDPSNFSFVGIMLSEGLGSDDLSAAWMQRFCHNLAERWPDRDADEIQRFWRASREETRKRGLCEALKQAALNAGWQAWMRLSQTAATLGVAEELPLPNNVAAARLVGLLTNSRSVNEVADVAAGRILCGVIPLWPYSAGESAILNLWPSRRRLVGLRLQHAAACGARDDQIVAIAAKELRRTAASRPGGQFELRTASEIHFWSDLEVELSEYWRTEWCSSWSPGWEAWIPFWMDFWGGTSLQQRDHLDMAKRTVEWAQSLARGAPRNAPRHWARDWARQWSRAWAHEWSISDAETWIEDFARCEFLSWGRGIPRSALVRLKQASLTSIEKLMAIACRCSMRGKFPPQSIESLHEAARNLPADALPIWLPLARHLAGNSSEEDRKILTEAAQNPIDDGSLLSSALRFIVRGDVLLASGDYLTLDQLADQCGAPRLPYIDECIPPH